MTAGVHDFRVYASAHRAVPTRGARAIMGIMPHLAALHHAATSHQTARAYATPGRQASKQA
eukprot:15436842-Alexandrium_andersonii.AAC.1